MAAYINTLAQWSIARVCVLILLLARAAGIFAAQEVARIPIIDAPPYTPGLGAALRPNNDIYIGGGHDLDVVPLFLYEGKYLFAHGTSAGLHAFRNDMFSLDLLVRYRFQRLDPEDDVLLDGLLERKQTMDAGISGRWRGRLGEIKAEWVTDVQDRHNGNEFELAYRYPFAWGTIQLSPFINVTWQDEDLTAYYYGVTDAEARPGRPAYTPGEAVNVGAGVNLSYPLTDRIFTFANVGLQMLDSTITDSPIVDADLSYTVFFGAGYLFGELNGTRTTDTTYSPLWSWRLNYGYGGRHNIVAKPLVGNLAKNEFADTNIAGITLGRLVAGGPRVDFYAKLALFRHLEDNLQDDFWSASAYMMAIGKGYFPWSDRVAFRWGFGFGVSLAQDIPMIEQIQQDIEKEETSHLMNYLEFTADFPIDGIIKAKFARNCYVGMTIVHRSGLFGSSIILGDVSGGGDWYTAHIECLR